MEDRRSFLARILPRLIGLTSLLSFRIRPARADSEESPFDRYLRRPKYVALLDELRVKHGFRRSELLKLFRQAEIKPEVLRQHERPLELQPYRQYRTAFVRPEVVEQGRQYLLRQWKHLKSIEKKYRVEPPIIGAVLAVESRFGRRSDEGIRVFDSLNTVFAEFPRRGSFARTELIEFLHLCREEKLDPLQVKGSYAGAMGVPQFIPSSYRRYAVDYDRDGRRDLWDSDPDILASVANYLKVHGWRRGQPAVLPVVLSSDHARIRRLIDQGIKGKTTLKDLRKMGVSWAVVSPRLEESQKVSLLAYATEDGERTVILLPNFRAILHYNRSVNYALVVAELAGIFMQATG